jgi:heptosyltransferase III
MAPACSRNFDQGKMIALPPHARILVVVMRRLGDVLLTTPLIRSLKRAFPDAAIEALVFAGTEGILAGNPDLAGVITVSRGADHGSLALMRALWRRYDLAVSTQSGDRPTSLAFIAGRRRVGLVQAHGGGAWWKRRMLDFPVTVDPESHRVAELLRLANVLGVESKPELVVPAGGASALVAPPTPYAVLHANPMYQFRRWTDGGWRTLAQALATRGLSVLVTGGPDPVERCYLDALWGPVDPPVQRFDGRLDWPQLAALIGGASVYVGPDTSVTHLAAGTGCPTVAIYGPESPHVIGPWPFGGLDSPWAPAGTIQHRGNVWVVQNPLSCLPCRSLGCERRIDSYSRCLDELPPRQVLVAVDQALSSARVAR